MTNQFIPPRAGQEIKLLCQKCNLSFIGPNPGVGIQRFFSRTKCPNCGSKRVVSHPGIKY